MFYSLKFLSMPLSIPLKNPPFPDLELREGGPNRARKSIYHIFLGYYAFFR